jgi:predicted phosphodiesterase
MAKSIKNEGSPLAALLSDLHLGHRCPIARGEGEGEGWYSAQKRAIDQVETILEQLESKHLLTARLPIVVAGDIVHRHNEPAELINFLLENLWWDHVVYAIPGNHDLPHHRIEDVRKSAYWTLVEAGRIWHLTKRLNLDGLSLHPFQLEQKVKPLPKKERSQGDVHLAVVHRYLWVDGHTYPDAPQEDKLENVLPSLDGYDAALYGDNHTPFLESHNGITVYNHGLFLRRRADERRLTPSVGILYESGKIVPIPLDTEADVWSDSTKVEGVEAIGLDEDELMEMLRDLGDQIVKFSDALTHYFHRNSVPDRYRARIADWLTRAKQ